MVVAVTRFIVKKKSFTQYYESIDRARDFSNIGETAIAIDILKEELKRNPQNEEAKYQLSKLSSLRSI